MGESRKVKKFTKVGCSRPMNLTRRTMLSSGDAVLTMDEDDAAEEEEDTKRPEEEEEDVVEVSGE